MVEILQELLPFKLQVLGFLWFFLSKLTLGSHSRFFSLLSSVSTSRNSPQTPSISRMSPLTKNPKSPLSSLSFPYLNHSHPLTHLPKSDQPPFLTPLCPPLPNLNVGVGWWEWVQPPTHIAIKAVGRPRRRGVRLFEESRASPKRRTPRR